MKFQNKIFYKFIFPQEFPYALVGYRRVWTSGKLAQTFHQKSYTYFRNLQTKYIGPIKKECNKKN
jgi:hypothetical protein